MADDEGDRRPRRGSAGGTGSDTDGEVDTMVIQRPLARLERGDALLIVDVQPDFCTGGALPVPEGERVIPILNDWVEAARLRELPIYASRDFHPPGHPSFRSEGGQWPPHCVQGTTGADYHPGLRLPARTFRIAKGTRLDRDQLSAFDETGLVEHLERRGVKRLWVGGLALEICVRASVLAALDTGLDVKLLVKATRPADPGKGESTLAELDEAGATLEWRG